MENQNQNSSNIERLDANLSSVRAEWLERLENMSPKVGEIGKLVELQTDCYTYRQRAVDGYYSIQAAFIRINSEYKREYGKLYDFYTNKSQIRYPNESSKTAKINSDLSELIAKRDLLDNHKDFMGETIKSIDAIIWGIKDRISIHQLLFNSVK